MASYVAFEIMEGAYEISCPDALCPTQGIITLDEINKLVESQLIEKHKKYRLNRGIVTQFKSIMYLYSFLCIFMSV